MITIRELLDDLDTVGGIQYANPSALERSFARFGLTLDMKLRQPWDEPDPPTIEARLAALEAGIRELRERSGA